MNKFPWDCGECPLLKTYDMSVDDLTHVCLWSKAQIDDCDRYKSAECPLDKHDAKVRADAIDEFVLKLSDDISFRSISDRIGCMEIFRGIAEELKEQKNDKK